MKRFISGVIYKCLITLEWNLIDLKQKYSVRYENTISTRDYKHTINWRLVFSHITTDT